MLELLQLAADEKFAIQSFQEYCEDKKKIVQELLSAPANVVNHFSEIIDQALDGGKAPGWIPSTEVIETYIEEEIGFNSNTILVCDGHSTTLIEMCVKLLYAYSIESFDNMDEDEQLQEYVENAWMDAELTIDGVKESIGSLQSVISACKAFGKDQADAITVFTDSMSDTFSQFKQSASGTYEYYKGLLSSQLTADQFLGSILDAINPDLVADKFDATGEFDTSDTDISKYTGTTPMSALSIGESATLAGAATEVAVKTVGFAFRAVRALLNKGFQWAKDKVSTISIQTLLTPINLSADPYIDGLKVSINKTETSKSLYPIADYPILGQVRDWTNIGGVNKLPKSDWYSYVSIFGYMFVNPRWNYFYGDDLYVETPGIIKYRVGNFKNIIKALIESGLLQKKGGAWSNFNHRTLTSFIQKYKQYGIDPGAFDSASELFMSIVLHQYLFNVMMDLESKSMGGQTSPAVDNLLIAATSALAGPENINDYYSTNLWVNETPTNASFASALTLEKDSFGDDIYYTSMLKRSGWIPSPSKINDQINDFVVLLDIQRYYRYSDPLNYPWVPYSHGKYPEPEPRWRLVTDQAVETIVDTIVAAAIVVVVVAVVAATTGIVIKKISNTLWRKKQIKMQAIQAKLRNGQPLDKKEWKKYKKSQRVNKLASATSKGTNSGAAQDPSTTDDANQSDEMISSLDFMMQKVSSMIIGRADTIIAT